MSGEMDIRKRADQILDQALEMSGRERELYLQEACGDSAELMALVRRLLASCESLEEGGRMVTGGALEGALAADMSRPVEPVGAPDAGAVIGRYRIVRELGRGGMATVYLAERDDEEFTHQVALKILQTGLTSDEVLRRFQIERQILAQARHPGVAQLIDAGQTDEGVPYLVMEYVEGEPIDTWADLRRLTLEDRLRLFLKVARTVAYAHRNLVVHRDIKPSNILVTEDGDVKLLDFGIAKLLGDDLVQTKTMQRMMTPAFASPEQIKGEPVTTATDVYQLGVLLYLMLTGRWPYPDAKESEAYLLLAICEFEPVKPSVALKGGKGMSGLPGQQEPSDAELEGSRSTSLTRMQKELAGDLDTILLMALRKEPERRYASVDLFIHDIERYLDGQTVSARPDTVTYRVKKFVTRNAAVSVLASASVLAIIILTVLYTDRLATERDHARIEAAKANATSEFLRGLFEVSAPTRAKGEEITALDLLNRGAARIDEDLAGQPELHAEMATIIGDVYRELAYYEEAKALLEKALATRREIPGPDRIDLGEALYAYGRVCERIRDLDAAREALEEALEIQDAGLGPNSVPAALTRSWLGVVATYQNRFDEARAYCEQAVQDLEVGLGPDAVEVGQSLNHLALVLRAVRDYEGSLPIFERGMAILDAQLEPGNPWSAGLRVNYADAVRNAGNPELADTLLTEALPQMEKAYGADHPYIGVVLTSHANLLRSMGDYETAERLQRRALEVWTESLGPDHVQISWCYNNLGLIRREQGDHQGALDFFLDAVSLVDRTLGPEDAENAVPVRNLAQEYRALGRYKESLLYYERSLVLYREAYGEDHSFLFKSFLGLGEVHMDLEEFGKAEPYLREAVRVGRRGESHLDNEVVEPLILLAGCLMELDRAEDAEAALAQAVTEGGSEERIAEARVELGL